MDPIPDAGQWAAAATQAAHGIAGLSSGAQVAAVVAVGLVALAWVLRPAIISLAGRGTSSDEKLDMVIGAITEQSRATYQLSERVEALAEKMAAKIVAS